MSNESIYDKIGKNEIDVSGLSGKEQESAITPEGSIYEGLTTLPANPHIARVPDTKGKHFFDANEYSEYIPTGVFDNPGLNKARANNQSNWEKFGHMLLRGGAKALISVVEPVGHILDLEQHINQIKGTEQEFSNWFNDYLVEKQEQLDKALPIHTATDQPSIGSADWWFKNGDQVIKSLGYLVPGGLIYKGTGAAVKMLGIMKGMRTAAGANAAQLSTNLLSAVGSSAMLNYNEHMLSATIAYRDNIEKYQQAGLSLGEAKKRAAVDAETLLRDGRWNMLWEIPSHMMLFRGVKFARQFGRSGVAKKEVAKSIASSTGYEMTQEFGEEVWTGFLESEASRTADIANGTVKDKGDTRAERFIDHLTSYQGMTEGLLGALGGAGMSLIMSARHTKDRTQARRAMEETAAVLGNKSKLKNLKKQDFYDLALMNAAAGTFESFEASLDEYANMTPEEAKANGFDEDYVEQASQYKEDAAFFADQYDDLNTKYQNVPKVALTLLNQKINEREGHRQIIDAQGEITKLKAEIGTVDDDASLRYLRNAAIKKKAVEDAIEEHNIYLEKSADELEKGERTVETNETIDELRSRQVKLKNQLKQVTENYLKAVNDYIELHPETSAEKLNESVETLNDLEEKLYMQEMYKAGGISMRDNAAENFAKFTKDDKALQDFMKEEEKAAKERADLKAKVKAERDAKKRAEKEAADIKAEKERVRKKAGKTKQTPTETTSQEQEFTEPVLEDEGPQTVEQQIAEQLDLAERMEADGFAEQAQMHRDYAKTLQEQSKGEEGDVGLLAKDLATTLTSESPVVPEEDPDKTSEEDPEYQKQKAKELMRKFYSAALANKNVNERDFASISRFLSGLIGKNQFEKVFDKFRASYNELTGQNNNLTFEDVILSNEEQDAIDIEQSTTENKGLGDQETTTLTTEEIEKAYGKLHSEERKGEDTETSLNSDVILTRGKKNVNGASSIAYLSVRYGETDIPIDIGIAKVKGTIRNRKAYGLKKEVESARKIQEGTPLKISVDREYVGDVYNENGEKLRGVTFDDYVKDGQIDTDNAPIKIEAKIGRTWRTIGYVHTYNWVAESADGINAENIADSGDYEGNWEVQKDTVRTLRKHIFAAKNETIETKVINKGLGNLSLNVKMDTTKSRPTPIMKKNGKPLTEFLKLSVAIPQTDIPFVVLRNGEFQTTKGTVYDGEIINKNVAQLEGSVFMVLPTPVQGKYLAVPIRNPGLKNNIAVKNTIIGAIHAMVTKSQGKIDKINVALKKAGSDVVLDIGRRESLKEFINQYVYTESFDHNFYPDRGREYYLDVLPSNEIVYFGVNQEDYLYKLGNRTDVEKFKDALFEHLDNFLHAVDINKLNGETQFADVQLDQEGNVLDSKIYTNYNSYLRTILETSVNGRNFINHTDKSKEYVYFDQPVVEFDISEAIKPAKVEKQEKKTTKPVEKKTKKDKPAQPKIDLTGTLFEAEDDHSSDVIVKATDSSRLADELKVDLTSFAIKGFSYEQQTQVVGNLLYHVGNSFMEGEINPSVAFAKARQLFENSQSKYSQIANILKGINDDLTQLDEDSIAQLKRVGVKTEAEARARVRRYAEVLKNWDTFESLTLDSLVNLGLELRGTYYEGEDSDFEQIKYGDDARLAKNPKDTTSFNFKMFLSAIEDVEFDENGKLITKTNYLGLKSFIPFDTVYDDIQSLLADTNPKYGKFIEILEDEGQKNPHLLRVAQKLTKSADEQLKSSFVSTMAKTYTPQTLLMYKPKFDSNGKLIGTTLNPITTNTNSIIDIILHQWVEDQKELPIVRRNDNGDLEIDLDEIAKIKEEYKTAVRKYQEINQLDSPQFLDIFRETMSKLGVTLPENSIDDLPRNAKWALGSNWEHAVLLEDKPKANGVRPQMRNTFMAFIFDAFEDTGHKDDDEGYGLFGVNNPLYGVNRQQYIRKLASFSRKYLPSIQSNSYRNSQGNMIYGYQNHTLMSQTFGRLKDYTKSQHVLPEKKAELNAYLDAILSTSFGKYSVWGNRIVKDQEFRDSLDIKYLDGLKRIRSNRKGINRKQMDKFQQELLKIGLFQNAGRGNTANFLATTKGDRTISPVITAKREVVNYTVEDDMSISLSSTTVDKLWGTAKGEIERILAYRNTIKAKMQKDDVVVGNYDTGAGLFFLFPYLNKENLAKRVTEDELGQIYPGGEFDPTAKGYGILKRTIVQETLSEINNKVKLWEDMGIIQYDNQGEVSGVLMDETYFATKGKYIITPTFPKGSQVTVESAKKMTEMIKLNKKKAVRGAAADLVVNYILANAAQYQLISGDPAFYYKESVTQTLEVMEKRLAKDLSPRITGRFKKPTFRKVISEDRYVSSSEAVRYRKAIKDAGYSVEDDAYEHIDSTDSQEYTSLEEHITVMQAYGMITDKIFNSIIAKINKGKYYTLSEEELDIVLQPQKPVYTHNQTFREYDMTVPYFTKSSAFPLIPQLTAGWELDNLRVAMETQGIDRLSHISAEKVGAISPTNIYDGGSIVEDLSDLGKSARSYSRDGFGLQQQIPVKKENKVLILTQMSKLLFEGTRDIKGMSKLEEEKEHIKMTMYETSKQELLDDLGIIEENGQLLYTDLTKVQKLLINEAKARNWSTHEIRMLKLSEDKTSFEMPFSMSGSRKRIESLLLSLITNRVIKQKIHGKGYVQGSQMGIKTTKKWKDLTKEERSKLNNLITTEEFNEDRGLTGMRVGEDGGDTVPAQVLLPSYFKDNNGNEIPVDSFTKIVDGKKYIDNEKLPAEVRRIIGARIPNQGHSSMIIMEVVGFIPEEMGDLAIVPDEIVEQMGSDFDFDKLYTYLPNYYWDKKIGKVNKVKYDVSNLDKLYDRLYGNLLPVQFRINEALQLADENLLQANKLLDSIFNTSPELSEYDRKKFVKDYLSIGENTYKRALRIPTREEFKRKAEEDILSVLPREELENRFIDIHWKVLSNPKVFPKMVKPLDMMDFKEEADLIQTDEVVSPLYDSYQSNAFLDQSNGAQLIGISALASNLNAIMEKHDLPLRTRIKGEDVPYTIAVQDHNGDTIQLSQVSGTAKSTYISPTGKKIIRSKQDNLIMALSAAVDNANIPILGKAHHNMFTAPVSLTLSTLQSADGRAVGIDFNTRLMTQPIIKEYVERVSRLSSPLADKYTSNPEQVALGELKKEYGARIVQSVENLLTQYTDIPYEERETSDKAGDIRIKFKENTGHELTEEVVTDWEENGNVPVPDSIVLSSKKLLEMREATTKNAQYFEGQLAALALFEQLSEVSKALEQVSRGLLFSDVNGTGGDMFEAHARSSMTNGLNFNTLIGNTEELAGVFEDGQLVEPTTELGSAAYNSTMLAVKMYDQFFKYDTPVVKAIHKVIRDYTGIERLESDDLRQIWGNVLAYVMSGNSSFGFGNVNERRQELLVGTNALGNRIERARQTWGKDNYVLQRIQVNKATAVGDPTTIRYLADGEGRIDEIESTRSLAVMLSSENDVIRKLGEDIVAYAVMTGGVDQPTSFIKFVPQAYLESLGLTEKLNNIDWNSLVDSQTEASKFKINVSTFVRQYFQHNPSRAKRIRDFGLMTGVEKAEGTNLITKFRLPAPSQEKFDYLTTVVDGRIDRVKFISRYDDVSRRWRLYEFTGQAEDGSHIYEHINNLGVFSREARIYEYNADGLQESLVKKNASPTEKENKKGIRNTTQKGTGGKKRTNPKSNEDLSIEKGLLRSDKDGKTKIVGALKNMKSNEAYKVIGEVLAESINKNIHFPLEYKLDRRMKRAGGRYSENINEFGETNKAAVIINPNHTDTLQEFERVFLHENTHLVINDVINRWQATPGLVSKEERMLMIRLRDLRDKAIQQLSKDETVRALIQSAIRKGQGKKDFESDELQYYGLINLKEFAAELISNPDFQRRMNEVEFTKGKTLFDQFLDIVNRFIKALKEVTGIEVVEDSVLAVGIDTVIKIAQQRSPAINKNIDGSPEAIKRFVDTNVTEKEKEILEKAREEEAPDVDYYDYIYAKITQYAVFKKVAKNIQSVIKRLYTKLLQFGVIIGLSLGTLGNYSAITVPSNQEVAIEQVATELNLGVAGIVKHHIKNHSGTSFAILDKDTRTLILFDKAGRFVDHMPALVGANEGDTLDLSQQFPDDARGKFQELRSTESRITAAGKFKLTAHKDSQYGGINKFNLKGTERSGLVTSLHVSVDHPSRTIPEATATTEDNNVTAGCITVNRKNYNERVAPVMQDGSHIYVIPTSPQMKSAMAEYLESEGEQSLQDFVNGRKDTWQHSDSPVVGMSPQAAAIRQQIDFRIASISKRLTGDLSTDEIDAIHEDIARLQAQKEQITDDESLNSIVAVANEEINWAERLAEKEDVTALELGKALELVGMWTWDSSSKYLSDRQKADTGTTFNKAFQDLSGRAESVQLKLIEVARDVVKDIVEENQNNPEKLLREDLTKINEISLLKSFTLDISHIEHPLVQHLSKTLTRSARNQEKQFLDIVKKSTELANKLKDHPLVDKEWTIFRQKDKDGNVAKNGGLVNELSYEWYEFKRRNDARLHRELRRADKMKGKSRKEARNKAWREFFQNKNKFEITVDTRFLIRNRFQTDEFKNKKAYIEWLEDQFGKEKTEYLIDRANGQYQKYKDDLKAYKELIESRALSGDYDLKVGENVEGWKTRMIEDWRSRHNPLAHLDDKIGGTPAAKFYLAGLGRDYVTTVPRKKIKVKGKELDTGFYDKDFLAIEGDTELREFYEFYRDTMAKMISYLPTYIVDQNQANRPNFIAVVQKDLLQRFLSTGEKGVLAFLNETMVDSLTTGEVAELTKRQATDRLERDPDTGRVHKRVPVRFLDQRVAPEDRSYNLPKILEMFAGMAINYKFKTEAEPQVLLMERLINEMEEIQYKGSNMIFDKFNKLITVKDGQHSLKESVRYAIDAMLYNQKTDPYKESDTKIYSMNPYTQWKKRREAKEIEWEYQDLEEDLMNEKITQEEYDQRVAELEEEYAKLNGKNLVWAKLGDKLLWWTQLKGMGYNLTAGIANVGFGATSTIMHAAGKTDFNDKQMLQSFGIMLRSLNPNNLKVANIMKKFNVLFEVTEMEYGKNKERSEYRFLHNLAPFEIQRRTEYFIQGHSFIAKMLNTKVTDLKGNERNLFEAYKDDGKWNTEEFGEQAEWSDDISATESNEFTKFRDAAIQMNKHLHGNYDPNSPIRGKKFLLGRMLLMFRTWMLEGFAQRWQDARYDEHLGRTVKGRYRSFGTIGAVGSAAMLVKQMLGGVGLYKADEIFVNERGKKLEDVDIENMRRNLREIQMAAALMSLGLILKAALGEDDDDDNIVEWGARILVNQLYRVEQDIYFYFSPGTFEDIIKNPIPAFKTINDFDKVYEATYRYLFDDEYRGEEPWIKAMKATPGLTQILKTAYLAQNTLEK